MTAHRDCAHPATRADRARCRKLKAAWAQFDADTQVFQETYIRPLEEQNAAMARWEKLRESEGATPGMVLSAEINADDTSREENFEPQSKRWYEVAYSTLAMNIDTGWDPYPDTK